MLDLFKDGLGFRINHAKLAFVGFGPLQEEVSHLRTMKPAPLTD